MSFQKENVCLTCLAPRQTEDPFISVFEKQNSEFTINFLEMLQTLTDIRMHDEFPRSICKECCSILLSSYRFRQTSNDVYKLLCKKLLPIQNGLVDSQPAVPFRSLQINSLQCLQKGPLDHGLVEKNPLVGRISVVPARLLIERPPVEPTLPIITTPTPVATPNFPRITSIMTTIHEPRHNFENLLTTVSSQQEVDRQESDEQAELRSMLNTPPSLFSCFDCNASFSGEQLLIDHRVMHTNPTVKAESNIELAAIDIPYEVKQEPVDIDDDSCEMQIDIECSIYNAEVNNNAALSSGLQIINVNSCDIEDVTPQALLDSSHASANNLECNLCQAPFSNDSELQQHRLSHSSQMTCSHCEKIFSQYDYLSNHTRDNHADQFLDFQKKTLLNGLECRVAIRLLKIPECTTCGSIFWNENNLKIHVQEEHSIVQIEEPPVSDQQKNVAVNGKADKHCQKCNHTFIRIDSYLKHMEAHIQENDSQTEMQINDPEAFNCTFCEKVFEDERNLKKHSMRIHNRNSMETDYVLAKNNRKNFVFLDESKASVRCKICEKVIGYKSLTSHMMLHSNIKRYGCEICEQKFARSDYLNNHMRQIHPNELRCDHCKLQLRSRLLLDQHLMTNHTEAYNIVNASQDTNEAQIVDIANVEIKAEPVSRDPSPTPQALLLDAPDNFIAASLSQACHQDSDYEDTEEDLSSKKKRAQTKSSAYFTCPICKKSLLQQSYRNHIQFHEDSKKCEVCGSEFARNDYLSSHMRNTHTEEQLRPFCCSVCSKMCATKKALAWHLQRFHKIDDSQSNESALLPEIAPVVSSLPVEKPVKAKISAFKCLPCERSFAGIHYYNMHMKCKHGIKSQQKASANLVQAAQAPPIPDPSVSSTSAMSVNETSSHENEDASADQELDKQYQFLRNKLEVKCNICLKTIKFKYIGRHMELHTKLKKYKCESCDEKFARSDYLSKHVRVYHLKELFCHLCKSQLFKKSAYYKHLLIVHNISEDLANSTMLDQSDTEENVNGYQDEDSSDDEVEMGQNEGEEVQSFNSVQEFRCVPCNQGFSDENYYNVHMKFKHTADSIVTKSPSQESDVVQVREAGAATNLFCEPCKKPFSSDYYMNVHNKFMHSGTAILKEEPTDKPLVIYNISEVPESAKETDGHTCGFCSKSFKILYKYNAHMKIKHGIDPTSQMAMPEEEPTESPEMTSNMSFETQTDENESIVSCPSVPSTSAVSSALSISINKGVNLFECDICDILLTRRDYLDRHVKSCHPNEFECQICNSQLSTFHYLMRHMHTAHATFKMIYNEYGCKQCHKQFSESENLALHIANKHSGKNTHNASINCNYCGMQFGNEKHKTRHSTLKGHNYMLKLMSRRKIQFNLEESNHIDQSKEANFKYLPAKLNDRHFECRICLKSFPQKRKATAHVKNHKEVFIYRCTQCNYTFLEKRVLDKHFGQYHKEAASQIEQLKNLNDHNNTMPELAHSTLSDDIFTPPAPKKLRMSLPNQALTTGDLPAHDASSFILRGPKGKSQCKVCSLLFNKRSDIMLHFKTHPEIPHATCTLCGFISVNQSYLNRHMKTTHGVVLGPDGVSFSSIEPKDERVPEPVPVPVPVPEPRPLINAQTMRDMQKRRMTRLSIAVSARYLVSEDPITEPITATKVPEKAQEPTKVIETAPEVKKIIPEASKETKLREIPTILSNGVEDLSVSAITTIDLLSDSEDVEDSLPSSSKSIACKICKRNFLRIDNLQNHIRHAHLKNNSENKCGVCENILDSPDLLVEHLRKHQDDNHKFICVICDKRYGVKNSLNRHNSQWHFKTNPEKDRPYYKQSSYKLTYFANPDAETGNVAKNEDSVGVAKGVPPAKVKKTLNVIPVSAANGFKIKFFKCNYCEKHFTRRDRMNLHRNVEHKKLIQDDQMRKKAKPVEEDDDSDELEESDEDSNAEDEVEAQKETTIANNIESNSTVMILPPSLIITKITQNTENVQLTSVSDLMHNNVGNNVYACDKCKLGFDREMFLVNHKKYFCYSTKQISPGTINLPSTSHV